MGDAERDLGVQITRVQDGRTPWEVFADERYIGNSRVDPCSKILKRELLRSWIDENCDPEETVVVLGIDWTEIHRLEAAQPRWLPYVLWAPLCEEAETDKASLLAELSAAGIRPPRLYEMGFPHNNCGGFCIKAGQAQFKRLLELMPERYRHHEVEEQRLRDLLGKNVAVLRDRRGGSTKPLTLRDFRIRIQGPDPEWDRDDWGGCGCALE